MRKLLNWFKEEESGQGMVEYGLIIALISIAVIALLASIGGELKDVFTKVDNQLTTAAAVNP